MAGEKRGGLAPTALGGVAIGYDANGNMT